MIRSCLYIDLTANRGRGVFTSQDIDAATVIEVSPVIVLNAAERILLDQTALHDYIFLWGETAQECCVGLGFLSLYNHNDQSNSEYEMNFLTSTMQIKTMRKIKKGEEVFINYNGDWDNAKPVWFEQKPDLK